MASPVRTEIYRYRALDERELTGEMLEEEGVLFHSSGMFHFRCPCGCSCLYELAEFNPGNEGLEGREWSVRIEQDGSPTLMPSVNHTAGCRSHFFITGGRVVWC